MKLDRSLPCSLESMRGDLIKVSVVVVPASRDVQLCLARLRS